MLRAHSISRVFASSVSVHLDAQQMTSFRDVPFPLRFLLILRFVSVCASSLCELFYSKYTHTFYYFGRHAVHRTFVLSACILYSLCEKEK